MPTATTANVSKFESLQDSLAMTISPSVFTLADFNKAKVYLTNKSSYHLTAGDHYFIEYLNRNVWEKITFKNVGFNDMTYGLDRRSPLQLDVHLKSVLHEYKKGKYRISKTLLLLDKGDKFLVSAEFLIQ
jgi:predicted transglutaminase-like protease